MKLHISPQKFEELIKKSYNLDIIYLLKLIENQYDVVPLYENSMRLTAIYQSLIRKGLITKDEEKLTTVGKDLLLFVDESTTEKKFVKKKPKSTYFEEWWKEYPSTDTFKYKGKSFKGTRAIRKDKNFMNGDYLHHDIRPKSGLKTARMLGHITYSSEAIMDQKFGRNFQDIKSKIDRDVDYEVENYLQYKGEKFSDIFDANSYILMTKAMDGYDASFATNGDLEKVLSRVKAKLLVVGFDSDWLYPPQRSKEIQLAAMNVGVACSCVILEGEQGHDSFLFASQRYVDIVKGFIES